MNSASEEVVEFHRRPAFLLRRAHQVAVAIFHQEIGALALTPPQHSVLTAIRTHPGRHQTALSRFLGYDRATVGGVLNGLEARGLVLREGSELDKRLRTLTLTRQGKQVLVAAGAAMRRVEQRITAPLSAREKPLLISLLCKIALVDGTLQQPVAARPAKAARPPRSQRAGTTDSA